MDVNNGRNQLEVEPLITDTVPLSPQMGLRFRKIPSGMRGYRSIEVSYERFDCTVAVVLL